MNPMMHRIPMPYHDLGFHSMPPKQNDMRKYDQFQFQTMRPWIPMPPHPHSRQMMPPYMGVPMPIPPEQLRPRDIMNHEINTERATNLQTNSYP